MKKIIQRLIIFFVGMPLILSPIYFLPQFNFLLFHIEILIVGIFATIEIKNIISKKIEVSSTLLLIFLGISLILAGYLAGLKILNHTAAYLFPAFAVIILMTFELVYAGINGVSESIQRLSGGIVVFVYPWLFLFFISRLTALPHSQNSILIFFLTVFFCDSASWFFGILLGKNNRGIIAVSPKKSIAGFAGGFIGAIAAGLLGFYGFKTFGTSLPNIILLSVFTCCAAILGDLIESMLKRASELKDSGQIVLGRGGILDSIDSILIAAPVFDISYRLLIGG